MSTGQLERSTRQLESWTRWLAQLPHRLVLATRRLQELARYPERAPRWLVLPGRRLDRLAPRPEQRGVRDVRENGKDPVTSWRAAAAQAVLIASPMKDTRRAANPSGTAASGARRPTPLADTVTKRLQAGWRPDSGPRTRSRI